MLDHQGGAVSPSTTAGKPAREAESQSCKAERFLLDRLLAQELHHRRLSANVQGGTSGHLTEST